MIVRDGKCMNDEYPTVLNIPAGTTDGPFKKDLHVILEVPGNVRKKDASRRVLNGELVGPVQTYPSRRQ